MRVRTVVGVAAVLAAGAGGVYVMVDDENEPGSNQAAADSPPAAVEAVAVSAPAEAVQVLDADPDPEAGPRTWLDLTLPESTEPSSTVTGEVSWTTGSGAPISGDVDLQRVEGAEWVTIDTVPVDSGSGVVDIEVSATSIYRVVYAGSDDVNAAQSAEVTVQAGDLMASTLAASARLTDAGYEISASWATADAIALRGAVEAQQEIDGEWVSVGTIETGDTGAGSVAVEAEDPDATAAFRLTYPGGPRFAAVTSEPASAIGDDVRTIPVSPCTTNHEIDTLANGEGCHFTPVSSGTFVVGHDYLGNSWWNAMPMGSVVELQGEQAGVYEVVERVIAPGRGAALGPASNWTCGEECDVILQTCQGSDTGFTWLRLVA